jgi:hypothetical protein
VESGRVKRRQKSISRSRKNYEAVNENSDDINNLETLDDSRKKVNVTTNGNSYANIAKKSKIPSEDPQKRRELEYERRNKKKRESKPKKPHSPSDEEKTRAEGSEDIEDKRKTRERRKALRIKKHERESKEEGERSPQGENVKTIMEAMTTMSNMFMKQMTIMQGMLEKMNEMFMTLKTNNGSKP